MEFLALLLTLVATISIASGQSITARPWFDPVPPGSQQQPTRQLVYPPLRQRPGQPIPRPRPKPRNAISTAPPADVVGYCAGQVYNKKERMCCEGVPVQGTAGRGFECCGQEAYNRYTHICCMGTVEPAPRGSKCCGSAVYHPSTEMCCQDSVVPGSEKTHQCCGVDSYRNVTHGCCGLAGAGGLFDKSTSLCCDGAITTDGPASLRECCGTNTFPRYGDHMCCGGHVVNANPGFQCCGVDAYNVFTDICCQDTIVTRTHPGLLDECCGTGVIGPFEACCANRTVYDPAMQQCCGSEVGDGTPPQYMCCGGLTYNILGENRCCNGMLRHAGPDAMTTACCGSSLYNQLTSTCCGGSALIPTPDYNCAQRVG